MPASLANRVERTTGPAERPVPWGVPVAAGHDVRRLVLTYTGSWEIPLWLRAWTLGRLDRADVLQVAAAEIAPPISVAIPPPRSLPAPPPVLKKKRWGCGRLTNPLLQGH
jgi:hypothetical protein